VYVFCHLKHKDQHTIDPLKLEQWDFYVLLIKNYIGHSYNYMLNTNSVLFCAPRNNDSSLQSRGAASPECTLKDIIICIGVFVKFTISHYLFSKCPVYLHKNWTKLLSLPKIIMYENN
jgi:hypothetical protein